MAMPMRPLSPKYARPNDLSQNELLFAIWRDLRFLRNVVMVILWVYAISLAAFVVGFVFQVLLANR